MENNEKIHRFMGADWTKQEFQWRPGASSPMTIEHLNHYRTSWGWLMPVVEKISAQKFEDEDTAHLRTFGMINDEGNFMVRFNRQDLFKAKTLLEATYLAVCDYVNSHPSTPIT
jgi:hypothetical protein